MHAASVHPEPGSNSRMFVFNLASASSNHFECYLSFSYFCLSCICSLRNFRVPFLHILYACTSLFVVQFSMTVSLPFFATALLLYQSCLAGDAKASLRNSSRPLKIKQYSKETKQTNPLIYGSRVKPAEWVRDHNGQSWKANEST